MKKTMILVIVLLSVLVSCTEKARIAEKWYCPMHTHYKSDKPGTCPICGMNLVKEDLEKHEDDKTENSENTVHISTEKQALIGIKTVAAKKIILVKKILSSGSVAYDPELYTAITEYKEALKISRTDSGMGDIVRSSKTKLLQMGLSAEQIQYWRSADPDILITGGKKGNALVYSQLYESDIPGVQSGQEVEVRANAFINRVFKGKIVGIDTVIDSNNRTLRIRSQVRDKNAELKPQMYAEVTIMLRLGKKLVVPREAVMDTGMRKIVYVKIDESGFLPVEVVTGVSNDEYYEISAGLKENDQVVVGANFLLDSESKLKMGGKEQ